MPNKLMDFSGFSRVFEGGAAIKSSRSIREDEFPKTLDSIKSILFPILGINPTKEGSQYLVIGSIGKKKNPEDTSGDLDIGYDSSWFSREHGITAKECSSEVYKLVSQDLPEKLGFDPEINHMKGLSIVSLGWPIQGDFSKGIVQLDLIPVSSMDWAKFIYYSPNYKIAESKYKSAHRNWLLTAILASRRRIIKVDPDGQVLDYDSPVLMLSDGLFWHTKSYAGKIKSRLKNPKKIEGSERFVTRNPQEFIDFTLGPGYTPEEVKTFEQVFSIISDPSFELYDNLEEIKDKFKEYLERTGLEVPSEINRI
jgi:hypothetical protein